MSDSSCESGTRYERIDEQAKTATKRKMSILCEPRRLERK